MPADGSQSRSPPALSPHGLEPQRCPGMEEVRWPPFPAEVCRGLGRAAPWESQCHRCPRAGVPSWGPRGSDGEGALPQSGCPEPAACGREATPDRAGALAADSSTNSPKPGEILQKSQTLRGLPTPGRFPEPAGSPNLMVSPQSAGSLHALDPDPAGSFKHHNPHRDALPTKFFRAPQGSQTLLGSLECPNTTRSPMEPQISQSLPPSELRPC